MEEAETIIDSYNMKPLTIPYRACDYYDIGDYIRTHCLNKFPLYLSLIIKFATIDVESKYDYGIYGDIDFIIRLSYTPIYVYFYWWPGTDSTFRRMCLEGNDYKTLDNILNYLKPTSIYNFGVRYKLK